MKLESLLTFCFNNRSTLISLKEIDITGFESIDKIASDEEIDLKLLILGLTPNLEL